MRKDFRQANLIGQPRNGERIESLKEGVDSNDTQKNAGVPEIPLLGEPGDGAEQYRYLEKYNGVAEKL